MSYLPGLRASLVEAARQRYAGAAEPAERRRGPRWITPGGIATAFAAATAVAIAVVAIVALGHHRASPSTAASRAISRKDLRRAATQAFGGLQLPPGAVRSGLVRGTPIELWSPSDRMRIPGYVDVYRIWRIPARPDRVISYIVAHGASGVSGGMNGESTTASGGGPAVIQQATGLLDLPATGTGIWRELALNAVRLPGGGAALRVDSEAGWLAPRPAGELIPQGVTRIELQTRLRNPRVHRSWAITKPARIKRFVSVFNTLPAVTAVCKSASHGVVRFVFEAGVGKPALAVAIWAPTCQHLSMSIAGRRSFQVMIGPDVSVAAEFYAVLDQLVTPRRVSGSTTTVNSSQGCATSTSSNQAHRPSAPGAAGGSCASGSRSTTSASSP